MKRILTAAVTAAFLVIAGRTAVRADAVTDCAAIQGKAYVAFLDGIFKEAARACGKGSAMLPLAVSQTAAAGIAGKLYKAVGKGVDKNGAAACSITLENVASPQQNGAPDDILNTIRGLANQACLVMQ